MREQRATERSFITVYVVPTTLVFLVSTVLVLLACEPVTLRQLTLALERLAVTALGMR